MRDPEWVEYAAKEFIRTQARYSLNLEIELERMRDLELRMEGVGAIRYDKIGSSGFSDNLAECVTLLDELRESINEKIANHEAEYQRALSMFMEDRNAMIVWLKYGKGYTWAKVGRTVGLSEKTCKRHSGAGFRYVFDHMPIDARRVHHNAEV